MTSIRQYEVSTKAGNHFSINLQDVGGDPRSRNANEFGQEDEIVAAAALGKEVSASYKSIACLKILSKWKFGSLLKIPRISYID